MVGVTATFCIWQVSPRQCDFRHRVFVWGMRLQLSRAMKSAFTPYDPAQRSSPTIALSPNTSLSRNRAPPIGIHLFIRPPTPLTPPNSTSCAPSIGSPDPHGYRRGQGIQYYFVSSLLSQCLRVHESAHPRRRTRARKLPATCGREGGGDVASPLLSFLCLATLDSPGPTQGNADCSFRR